MKPREIGAHLTVDPRVCHGKLTFKGTRVPVETVLYFLSTGQTFKQLQDSWPKVKREGLQEAIQLAGGALVKRAKAKATYQGKAQASDEPAYIG
jgi:uncharacterized protein (DUF433 family)